MLPLWAQYVLAMAAAFLAGGINSIAGGGTLVTFPSLMGLGLPAIGANATSTVAIWPGSIGSLWGFREEIRKVPMLYKLLVIPSVIGGVTGAWLLRNTSSATFEKLVPFLILFATVLFSVQALVQKQLKAWQGTGPRSTTWIIGAFALQLGVGVYGGYFGAGMSIMMLTALAFLGMEDILEMSATTSLLSFATNGVASLMFIFAGMVNWTFVLVMMPSALFGGYAAAGVARKVGKATVRKFVIGVGVTIAVVLFVKVYL